MSGLCDAGIVTGIIDKKIKQVGIWNNFSFYFIDVEKGIPPVDVEKAFLYVFSEVYGEMPICNKQGKRCKKEVVKKVEEKFLISTEDLIEILKKLENEQHL